MNNAIPHQVLSFLQSASPFDLLTELELASLCQSIKVIYLTRENAAELMQQVQPALFLIASGEYTITDSMMSELDACRHLSQGDYFNYSTLLDGLEHNLSIDSEDPGLVYAIAGSDFDAYRRQYPNFNTFFQRMHRRELHRRHTEPDGKGDSESMWLHSSLAHYCEQAPVHIAQHETIAQAAKLMSANKISSLLIVDGERLSGIITDRDLRHRVLAQDIAPTAAVASVMTSPTISIDQDATVFDALMLMTRHNIHHLPVTNSQQLPVGVLTASDLIRQQQSSLLFLIGALNKSKTLSGLIEISKQVPDYLQRHASRLGDYDIASHFLTQTGDLITEKLADFFMAEHGAPPCKFAWVSYGSQARGELLPSSDQDNGLLLEREVSGADEKYFARFSDYICQNLARCGQKLCPGNIMASNPKLQLTPAQAISESAYWVSEPTPDAVMRTCIFLDMRIIFGCKNLFDKVSQARQKQVQQPLFLAALAANALNHRPPLTLFQRFVYDKGRHNNPAHNQGSAHSYSDGIDLKSGAIHIINSIIRLYAFAEGVNTTGTLERLQQLSDKSGLVASDRHDLKDIWLLLQRLRWRHQLEHGIHNSAVRQSNLSSIEQHQLKAAFKAIRQAQEALLLKFAPGAKL